jgi:hypothetical protein
MDEQLAAATAANMPNRYREDVSRLRTNLPKGRKLRGRIIE